MCCNVRLNACVLQCIPISEMQFYFKILLVLSLLFTSLTCAHYGVLLTGVPTPPLKII